MNDKKRYRVYQKGEYYGISDDVDNITVISCIRTEIEAEWLCNLLNEKENQIRLLNERINDYDGYVRFLLTKINLNVDN